MKKTSKALVGLAFAASALASLRVVSAVAADTRRYDRLRTMSGDGPLIREFPAIVTQVLAAERKAMPGLLAMIVSLPSDALRYVRMKSM